MKHKGEGEGEGEGEVEVEGEGVSHGGEYSQILFVSKCLKLNPVLVSVREIQAYRRLLRQL